MCQPAHRHSAGPGGERHGLLAETPRPPALLVLCHARSPSPGEPKNFISAPRPSWRALPSPCAAAESTGCVTSRRRRGTRRHGYRTLSPAPSARGGAAKPARDRTAPAGAAAAPKPSPPVQLWPGVEVSVWERGAGSRLGELQPLTPQDPARDSGEGGTGTPHRSPVFRPGRDPSSSGNGTSSPYGSTSSIAQMRKAREIEPEF